MSDLFGFCERYLTTDGKEYIDANSVREALGIVDEYVDILGVIKKLKKERDGLKADLELTKRLYKENHDFVDKVCEAVDIRRPYTESGYDNAVKLIAGFKRERDELKEKCDKMKKRANAMYGVSCGYSGDKAPAFLCDVISYSWSFGAIDTPFPNNSIRVELNLTPTANYKGTFDLEDLKKYIQAYGREKKLGIVLETLSEIDEHIDELCDKYTVVQPDRKSTTKERLDYIFGVLAELKDITDRYDELEDFRAGICEILGIDADELFGSPQQNDMYILEQVKKLKKTPNRDTFRDAICNALNMPTTVIDGNIIGRINMIQDCHDKLARLRSDICTALCLGCETYDEDILKTIRRTKEYHDALCDDWADLCEDYKELRKSIWEAMDRKPDTLPEENARLVGEVTELARGEKLLIEFRDDVAKAIGMEYPTTNQVILQNVKYIYKDREDAYGMVAKLNDQVTALEKAKEDLQQMLIDSRYGGLKDPQRDLLGEYLKEAKDILGIDTCEKDTVASAIKALKSAYEKLQKDYDELGEAYSSVLKWNNSYAEVRRLLGVSADADADEMVDTLDQLVVDREKCKRRYENWYSRYESEHTRANGEHKRAEKLRKDVTVLTNRIELLKLSNASQANSVVASQAFKNECRKLKEEKAKVIAALGQEIWDDCVK